MFLMNSLQEAASEIGWYWYLLLVLVVLGGIVWWMYTQSKAQSKKEEKQVVSDVTKLPESEKREDDLTKIEGIGPKVAKVLNDAGITNFESLSSANPSEIKTVLNEAGLQMMSPEGWIEQAHLAAEGDWDGLQKLQDELKGGRRK